MHNKYQWTDRRRDGLVGGFIDMIRKIAPCDRICCHHFPFITRSCRKMSSRMHQNYSSSRWSLVILLHPTDWILALSFPSATIWVEVVSSEHGHFCFKNKQCSGIRYGYSIAYTYYWKDYISFITTTTNHRSCFTVGPTWPIKKKTHWPQK